MTGKIPPLPETLFRIALGLGLGLLALRAAFLPEPPFDMLAISDNDDIMRFLSVRDLLAGQGWFDTVQYRILPPEGLPMHWSRYVDGGIAAVIALAALVQPMQSAESVGLVAWPTLMLAGLVVATGLGLRRVLGPGAAALCIVMILIWPVTSYTYFRPARLDHHNVQILIMAAMALTLIRPGSSLRLGLAGGALAALSMAVGLETVPLVALAGLVLAARAAVGQGETGTHLLAFGAALALGSVLLFAGQTPPERWLAAHCDQLSPPWLALALIGFGASAALVVTGRRVSRGAGLAALCAVLGLGLLAAAPLLAPCLRGPYAVLPPDVMRLIPTIREAHPAHWFLLNGPAVFWANIAPAIGAVLAAAAVWVARRARGAAGNTENRALATLLVLGGVPLLGTFVQVRLVVLSAPVVPMLAGYALAALLADRMARPTAAGGLALAGAVIVTLMPPLLYDTARNLGFAGEAETDQRTSRACRTPEIVRSLDALAPGTILAPINFGPPIVLLTRHAALAGPYHRRPEALANGIVPFDADEAGLRAALERTRADYLVLCRGVRYGEGRAFAAHLSGGARLAGFEAVPGVDPALLVLRKTSP